jgi:voltage-gated potassium channel
MLKKILPIWGTLILLFATYTAIELPLWIILKFELNIYLIIISLVISFFFFIDLLLSLYTYYFKERKRLFHYFKTTFILDFISIFPFDVLLYYYGLSFEFKVLSFIRVIKILQLIKLSGFVKRWGHGEFSNPAIMRIFYFLYWIFLVLHWVACGWIVIKGKATGVDANGVLIFIDNTTTYIRAFYFAMTTLTTIGYGDITPSTNLETVYVIIIQFLGAGMYGYIIGNIANLLSNVDQAKTNFMEKIEKINTFLKYRNIPMDLQEKINQYYSYLWENKRGFEETSVLNELPSSLKMKVALYLNKDMLEKIPILNGASDSLLNELILSLQPTIFIPGDYVFRKGDLGTKLYFIVKGKVSIIDDFSETVYAILTEGNFFGEIALLTSAPRNATVRADDYCDMYTLDKKNFDEILTKYPDFALEIKAKARERR